MPTAIIKCACKTCGKSFEITKECFCKAAAESYESYAEDYFSECKSCYAARMKKENAEKASVFIAKYNLPEIKGVTAKQISYANSLRNRWLANESAEIRIKIYLLLYPLSSRFKTVSQIVNESDANKIIKALTKG
jgi:hypothetical protein